MTAYDGAFGAAKLSRDMNCYFQLLNCYFPIQLKLNSRKSSVVMTAFNAVFDIIPVVCLM